MACCMSSMGRFEVTGTPVTGAINNQTSMFQPHMEIISDKMCKWAAPEFGDEGEDWEKTIWKAAIAAVATINTLAQIAITEKRYQLAKDYLSIAQDKWRRFRDHYAVLERSILNEIQATPEPVPDYEGAENRGTEHASEAFGLSEKSFTEYAKKYALCVDPSLTNSFNYQRDIAIDDGVNFNYRDEEYFCWILSDLRWNWRSEMLNLGRNIHSEAATYASAANDALAGLGNLAGQGAQGLMQLMGYMEERRDTYYPAQFSMMAPIQGPQQSFGSFITTGPIE